MPYICGVLPVLEALRAGGSQIDHVVVVKGARDIKVRQVLEATRRARVPVRREPRAAIDLLTPNADNQSVLAITASAPATAVN